MFWTNGTVNPMGWKADHYFLVIPGVNWTSFKVMADRDATVYLTSLVDDTNKLDHYEVTINSSLYTIRPSSPCNTFCIVVLCK